MNGRPSNANDPLLLPWNHPAGLGQTLCLRHGRPGLSTISLRRIGSLGATDDGLAVGRRFRRGIPRLVDGLDFPLVNYTAGNDRRRWPGTLPVSGAGDGRGRGGGLPRTPLVRNLRMPVRFSELAGTNNRWPDRFVVGGFETVAADDAPVPATIGLASALASPSAGAAAPEPAERGREAGIRAASAVLADSSASSGWRINPLAQRLLFARFAPDVLPAGKAFAILSRKSAVSSRFPALSERAVTPLMMRSVWWTPPIESGSRRADRIGGLKVDSTPGDRVYRQSGIPAADWRDGGNGSALNTVRPRPVPSVALALTHNEPGQSRRSVSDAISIASTGLGSDRLEWASKTGHGAPLKRRADELALSAPAPIDCIVIPLDAPEVEKSTPPITSGSDVSDRDSDRGAGGMSETVHRFEYGPIRAQVGRLGAMPTTGLAIDNLRTSELAAAGLSFSVSRSGVHTGLRDLLASTWLTMPAASGIHGGDRSSRRDNWPGVVARGVQNLDAPHQRLSRLVMSLSSRPAQGRGSDGTSLRELSKVPGARGLLDDDHTVRRHVSHGAAALRGRHMDIPSASGSPEQLSNAMPSGSFLPEVFSPARHGRQSVLRKDVSIAIPGSATAVDGPSLRIASVRHPETTGALRASGGPDEVAHRAASGTRLCRFDLTVDRRMRLADPAYPFSWLGLSNVRRPCGFSRAVAPDPGGSRYQSGFTEPQVLPVNPIGSAAGDATSGRLAVGFARTEPLVSWNNGDSALHRKACRGVSRSLDIRRGAGAEKVGDNSRLVVVPATQSPMNAPRPAENTVDPSGAYVGGAAASQPEYGGVVAAEADPAADLRFGLESAPMARPLFRKGFGGLQSASYGRRSASVDTAGRSSSRPDMSVAVLRGGGPQAAFAPEVNEEHTPGTNVHLIRQRQASNPVPGNAPMGTDAVPAGPGDVDELLDKLWFRLMRRLSLEKERRGWTRWN